MLQLTVPERLKSYDVQTLSDCRRHLQEFLSVFLVLCLRYTSWLILPCNCFTTCCMVIYSNFYCTMLCIAQTMPLQDVCLSVCLSIHLSIHHNIHFYLNMSSNFYTILVYLYLMVWQYSDGRQMQRGMKKSRFFNQYLALSRKWYKIDSQLLLETIPKLLNGTSFIDLVWLLTQIPTSNNSKMVQDRAILTMADQQKNRKSYVVNQTMPFTMTLNNP